MWESNFYIPFYRIFEDETTKQEFLSGPHRSKKHISAQIRKLKGGDSKLGDPLENVLTNWMHLIDSAARNKARASAFEVGQQVGMIEKVERSELVKVLGSEKVERFAVVKEGNTKATRLFDTDFEAQAFIDSKPGPYKIEKRITYNVQFGSMKDYGLLSFQKNGEAVYFKTEDQDLYEALSEIDTQAFSNIVMRMMGSAKRALSYGATFGPAFRIRNMLRDTVHTAVVSKSFKPFYDTARGFVKSMREDQDYIEYMASGFGFGSSYIHSDDPQVGAKYIKKIVASEGKGALRRIIDPLKPWDNSLFRVWEKIGSASENAARLGLYTNLKKEGMDNFNAGFEGRDLMDFSMIGSAQATQMMVRIIPFLNARMQGLYKLGRSSRENPKAFLLKASILTTAALTLWSIFKDDDRYKDLEDWDKWTYFHFWIGEEHWRIPKPFEIGALFASLPESIANVMNGSEEGRFVLEWFVHTTRDTFNVDRPQLFKPAAEVNFNYDTFRKRKIVPTGLENLETSEQYQPWTSDTMKLVGGMTGMSPLKLEHLVKGYFSTLGAMVLSGTDVVVRGMTDAPSLPEGRYTPFDLGLKVDGSRGSKYVSRFYDLYSEIDELNRTYKHYIKTGQVEKAQDIYIKYEKLLRAKTAAYKYRKALSALTAEIKKTYRRKDFTAEEKSQHIDKLTSLKNKLSKAFFQSVKG